MKRNYLDGWEDKPDEKHKIRIFNTWANHNYIMNKTMLMKPRQKGEHYTKPSHIRQTKLILKAARQIWTAATSNTTPDTIKFCWRQKHMSWLVEHSYFCRIFTRLSTPNPPLLSVCLYKLVEQLSNYTHTHKEKYYDTRHKNTPFLI